MPGSVTIVANSSGTRTIDELARQVVSGLDAISEGMALNLQKPRVEGTSTPDVAESHLSILR